LVAQAVVFIIGEEQVTRDALAFLLGTHGLTVRQFTNPAEALSAHIPRLAGCVLLAQETAADGLISLAMLRREGVSLPAVLMAETPTRVLHDRAAELDATVVDVLCVPVLVHAVEQALDRGSGHVGLGPCPVGFRQQECTCGWNNDCHRCNASRRKAANVPGGPSASAAAWAPVRGMAWSREPPLAALGTALSR